MAGREWSRLLLLVAAGCSVPAYSPCPLDLAHELPPDAFARCREVLLRRYGTLVDADAAGFRLQTAWQPTREPPGERRASVFLDSERARSLSIVVETRWLTVPVLGTPGWTAPRGDPVAERELAESLRAALTDPGSADGPGTPPGS